MNEMTYASFLLCNLMFLEFCRDLSFNKLASAIPHELGELSQLRMLYFDDNKLNDTLPKQLGKLSKLRELWVTSNYNCGSA
ncbi:hypothetical protein Patl1_09717 [Pistacia atlantica]|uniref:Uncharacterized protein n=1 Tax=Pistacia atlantica TaxID=434234 RepID=A0ACC1A835_9ROSI|nr:hypothetical protein Patl1_09717 [Pistacia atlantica]